MSYRKKHVKSKIQRIKPKKSILTKLWFWIVILFLLTLSGIFYLVFFYAGLQVKDIVILGNDKVGAQDLREVASMGAEIELFNFWNIKIISRGILFANSNRIRDNILEKYPEIETAIIRKKLPGTLTLDIVERKPIGIFCGNDDRCFSIDNKGIIFEPEGTVPGGTTIIRRLFGNAQVFAGEKAVAESSISAIYKIQKSLEDDFQIGLKEALITSPVRLNVETNENWKIYFDLSGTADINLQITKLNLLLNNEISSDKRGGLRYVDLRPKDRAIVCDNSVCGG